MQKAEATVHIWRPAEFNLGKSNPVEWGKRSPEPSKLFESMGNFDVLTPILNSFVGEWRRSVGHASLSVMLEDGRQLYLSFWPEEEDTVKILRNAFGKKLGSTNQRGLFIRSLEEDIYLMDSPPKELTLKAYKLLQNQNSQKYFEDVFEKKQRRYEFEPTQNIKFLLPDGEAVYNYVSRLKGNQKDYYLLTENCSTFVIEALKEGSKSIKFGFAEGMKDSYGKSKEALKLGAILSGVFQGKSKEALQSAYNLGFSLPKSVSSLIEIFNGETPNSVQRYAEKLQKIINQ